MKIERLSTPTTFGKLHIGDIFMKNGYTFMKMLDVCEEVFAVDLENGTATEFNNQEEVLQMLSAKLVM